MAGCTVTALRRSQRHLDKVSRGRAAAERQPGEKCGGKGVVGVGLGGRGGLACRALAEFCSGLAGDGPACAALPDRTKDTRHDDDEHSKSEQGEPNAIGYATSVDGGTYMLITPTATTSGPLTGVTSLTFNGMGGNDTLQVNNPSGGLFAPSGGRR